jgi:hypothetical protein
MYRLAAFYNSYLASRYFHKQRWLLVIILSFWTTNNFAASTFTTTGSPEHAQFIINQISGAVSFCTLYFNTTTVPATPTGNCLQIGTISADPDPTRNPSLSVITNDQTVSDPTNNNIHSSVGITNVYTGQVWECTVSVNITTRVSSGRCALIGTVH